MCCSARRPSAAPTRVARTTLGQMVIRIALQCNEADAYLIMDDNNPAPRLLSRPGEGIYNDTAGAWKATARSRSSGCPTRCATRIWTRSGSAPTKAGTGLSRADRFRRQCAGRRAGEPAAAAVAGGRADQAAPVSPRIWLGAPNSIKGPTEAVFHRQSGNNLLIVGQREEAALAMLSIALVSLAAQYPLGRRAIHPVRQHRARHRRSASFSTASSQAIPHPITRGQAGRPGRSHERAWPPK